MGAIKIDFQERKYILPAINGDIGKIGLICPICSQGKLKLYTENITARMYGSNRAEVEEICDYPGECLDSWFSGFFVCNFKECGENIHFAGKFGDEDDGLPDKNGCTTTHKIIKIEYIECPPHIIKINHANIPNNIYDTLLASFRLYWIDINSCAEKIKICLEQIMNKLRIGGGDHWATHFKDRIKNLSTNHQDLEEIMSSSKINWIKKTPNFDEEITEDDLRVGYEMLDFILKQKADLLNTSEVS